MNQNDNIDVRQLWNIVARRKWAIASLAIGAGVLAALVVFAMTPTYKASAAILIESTQANVVSIQEVYGLDTQNQQYYASQFEILKSRPIIEAVISSLGLADNPEFNPDEANTRFKIDWRSWLPETFYDLNPKTEDEEVQRSVEVYREKLSVNPVRKTQLVNVHFESEDPALAARIANTHAQAYIDSMLDARVTATQSASGWMSTRIEGLQQKLLESERKLQEFRERESLVDVEGLKSLPAKEVNDLTARLADARRRLSVAKIAYLQVYGSADVPQDSMTDIPAILNDEVVQKFQQAKAVAQQKVAELEKRYGPLHPKMIAAQADLAKASENLAKQQGSVAASLQNDYEAAQSEVTELERALSRAKQQYQKVGRVESSLANLQREVDTNRELYDLFYSRLKETAETGDMESANARIISPAVLPYKPFKPRKKLVVGLAALAGLAIGVIAVFLLESLNNTIRSSTDVEEKLGLPLLGMLPILENKKKNRVPGKEVFDKRESAFNEVIRTVRTGIALSNLDKPHKVILVTSSIGDEGKTTVATDLAFAFAKTERVLLIDCDLRRPSVGTNLGLARNMPGLTDLIGETSSPAESITYVEHGGFHVLQSGLIPPDPQSVLSSRRVSNLFGALHKFYDRIIVDSPPVNPVSDAVMLSVHADAVVFVVRSDSTSVHQIKGALHQLQRVNAPLTGVVVNQLNTRLAEKYSDYGYGGYGESYEPYQLEEPERAVG